MSFPMVGCEPQPFTMWLVAAAIGVVALALETGVLVVVTRRQSWGTPIVLAAATVVAAGLTVVLGMRASQYASDIGPRVGCDVNGTFLVTAADSTQVLAAYEAAGQLFGAIMGLLLFGSFVAVVSLVASTARNARVSA
jgi:hypothetical protein